MQGKRPRKVKQEAEVVLICNPRAGGRWKALAGILDSEEARHVRRIVTDSVEDIATRGRRSGPGRQAALHLRRRRNDPARARSPGARGAASKCTWRCSAAGR